MQNVDLDATLGLWKKTADINFKKGVWKTTRWKWANKVGGDVEDGMEWLYLRRKGKVVFE